MIIIEATNQDIIQSTVCCGVRGRALASHTDVRGFEPQCGSRLTCWHIYGSINMSWRKKGAGSKSTIIVGPSKSVLVYVLHSLEYVLGLARFRLLLLWMVQK